MATTLPYLSSYKNVDKFFDALAAAKSPEAVRQRFLSDTLGLKSTGDRALIPLLRQLGFIDASGKPTSSYNALKNPSKVRAAMAEAIRAAYKPLFDANEHADALNGDDLKGLVAQVAGTDKDMTSKIVGTFNALKRRADFSAQTTEIATESPTATSVAADRDTEPKLPLCGGPPRGTGSPEFHFNIQVHLPASATEEVYVSIFAAIRKVFG